MAYLANGFAPEAMLGVNTPKLAPSFVEQTRGQVAAWGNTVRNEGFGVRNPYLAPLLKEWKENSQEFYRKVRTMRKHPTVRLTRELIIATMAQAEWSVEENNDYEAPEGAKEYVQRVMLPLHDQMMGVSLRGTFDYGWQPWEKIFKYNLDTMQIEVGKMKPLLQDQTDIVIQTDTGAFAGLKQYMTFLPLTNVLLVNRDVEGTYFYGEGAMTSMEVPYNRWLVTDDSNTRYDRKISGAHWIIHYPPGITEVDGQKFNNFNVAKDMLRTLEGSGSIVLPNSLKDFVNDLNANSQDTAWVVELVTADASAQAGFQQRLAYLDTLMVRAGGFPERAILEGQYGTKAEAEAHADFAVSNMDYQNKQIVNQINKFLVNQLLGLNFGPKAIDSIRLTIAPIADDKIDTLRNVYNSILTSPMSNEMNNIDIKAIREKVGVPALSPEEQAAMMQQGPDYTGGTGINGGNDPMLQRFLSHLNAPDAGQGQQMPQPQMGSKA